MTTLNIVGKLVDNKVFKNTSSNNHFNDCYFELSVPRNFYNDIDNLKHDLFKIYGWSGIIESVVNNSKPGDWISLVGRIELLDDDCQQIVIIAENVMKLI